MDLGSNSGQNVLLFDEVIDSGDTVRLAKEYLQVMGVSILSVATLCYKPKSGVKPDHYAFSTDAWVVFPHELREFIQIRFGIGQKKVYL